MYVVGLFVDLRRISQKFSQAAQCTSMLESKVISHTVQAGVTCKGLTSVDL